MSVIGPLREVVADGCADALACGVGSAEGVGDGVATLWLATGLGVEL